MPFLAWLARVWLLRRLFGGGSRRGGYGRRGYGRGYSRRRRGSFGMFGPVPTYSRQTRGGGRVSVGGCCLPIPLVLAVTAAGAARSLLARR
ncbi:MAG TPA: hypothetical protein VF533_02535 [Solirubrobacteraceae bacterium]|jgi:hypothetical protein